jgi:hypothetical protein
VQALQSQHYQPFEVTVELPAADGTFDEIGVVVFDFVAQLFALLSDPRLNMLENLVLNNKDPFDRYSVDKWCYMNEIFQMLYFVTGLG